MKQKKAEKAVFLVPGTRIELVQRLSSEGF